MSTLNDWINANIGIPGVYGVNDKVRSFFRRVFAGAGSPEGVIPASPGSIYFRTDGGVGTSLYVKEQNTNSVGWAPIPGTGSGGGGMTNLAVQENGVTVGSRQTLNLIDGTEIVWTVADNAGSDRVDVTPALAPNAFANIFEQAAAPSGVGETTDDLWIDTDDPLRSLYRYTGSAWELISKAPEVIPIACSDEITPITTGNAKVTFRMPFAMTLTAVRASLTTASSVGIPTFDINEAGTTILSTKLTVDATEKTSTTATTPAVISDSTLADDAEITIDFDVAGTGATGVKIYLIGYRT